MLVIEKALIISMVEGEAPFVGDVLIDGSRIVAVVPATESRDLPPESERIDGAGKLLLPGLVNAHTHSPMNLFRSMADDLPLMTWLSEKILPAEDEVTEDDAFWAAQLALCEMIRGGTTAFADMYFFMPAVARAVEAAGIRASLCRGLTGLDEKGDQRLADGRRFVEEWNGRGSGRITTMLGPHAPYTCPPDYLKSVAESSADLGVPIHIHMAETEAEVQQMREQYGMGPFEMVDSTGMFSQPSLAAHCVHTTAEDVALIADRGVRVAHNPGSNMKLGSGIADVPALLRAGVIVGLGTDGAASNNDVDMVEEIRLAALLHKVHWQDPTVVNAEQALAMATRDGARALFLDGVGCIAPGFAADMILVSMEAPYWHPLHDPVANFVYAGHAADVETVIVDGNVLMRDRSLLCIDEDRVFYEISRRVPGWTY